MCGNTGAEFLVAYLCAEAQDKVSCRLFVQVTVIRIYFSIAVDILIQSFNRTAVLAIYLFVNKERIRRITYDILAKEVTSGYTYTTYINTLEVRILVPQQVCDLAGIIG